MCTGSSTRHIVTFDGQNFKLTGNCSYVLFRNTEQDLEVILHNGACSPGAMQACMKSIEVKHAGFSVGLHSDMEVRQICSGIHGRAERSFRKSHMVLGVSLALPSRALPPSEGFLAISLVLAWFHVALGPNLGERISFR